MLYAETVDVTDRRLAFRVAWESDYEPAPVR